MRLKVWGSPTNMQGQITESTSMTIPSHLSFQLQTPASLLHGCLVIQWRLSKGPLSIVFLVHKVIASAMAAILGFALQAHLMFLLDHAAMHILLLCRHVSRCDGDGLHLPHDLTIPHLTCLPILLTLPVFWTLLLGVVIILGARAILLLTLADPLPKVIKLVDCLLGDLGACVTVVVGALLVPESLILVTSRARVLDQSRHLHGNQGQCHCHHLR